MLLQAAQRRLRKPRQIGGQHEHAFRALAPCKLQAQGGGAPIPLNISQENFGADRCKGVPRLRFVGKVKNAGRSLPEGRHQVVITVDDGQQNLSRTIVLVYKLPPAYLNESRLKNRIIKWSAAATEFTATRYDANDDTSVPGDLQINPPVGAGPTPLQGGSGDIELAAPRLTD